MITIKNENEIEILRQGGKFLAQIIKKLATEVKPGVTTGHLEKMACVLIKQVNGRPSFKNYQANNSSILFPTALCTSINNEIVHSPSLPSRKLKLGDIVSLDLGMEYPANASQNINLSNKSIKNWYYTDVAITVPVGKISKEIEKLIKVTRKALQLGVKQIRPGNSLNSIGKAIEKYVNEQGFSVVRELVGHGVGYAVHEDPQIPNYEMAKNDKIILQSGMVLAIEPMVNAGDWRIQTDKNDFSILTVDNSLSAHFEQTVLITKNSYEILTKF
ncbi:MAG: type I methionyl aminopeptidase [Patescibacteria group bacterium]